jgi:hypothetical protein
MEIGLPEDARCFEVLARDGKLAVALWVDEGDVVHVSQPGDRDFDRYCKAFGLQAARVVDLAKATATP